MFFVSQHMRLFGFHIYGATCLKSWLYFVKELFCPPPPHLCLHGRFVLLAEGGSRSLYKGRTQADCKRGNGSLVKKRMFVERNWMNEQCKYKVFWQAIVVNFNFMYFVPTNRFFVDYLQNLHKISQYSSVWVFCSESALSAFFINQFRFLIKNYLVNKFLQYNSKRFEDSVFRFTASVLE